MRPRRKPFDKRALAPYAQLLGAARRPPPVAGDSVTVLGKTATVIHVEGELARVQFAGGSHATIHSSLLGEN